jgi:hypothetical protein
MIKRLALLAAPFVCLTGPALAADLGPYPERETYLRPPAVERKIIKETYVRRAQRHPVASEPVSADSQGHRVLAARS